MSKPHPPLRAPTDARMAVIRAKQTQKLERLRNYWATQQLRAPVRSSGKYPKQEGART